jgi:hypothetical protein
VCYRDFRHWDKSYQHMCSDTIIFHMCWYRVLVNQRFPRICFWIWVKCLPVYNKQNNTRTLGDMNLSACVQARYNAYSWDINLAWTLKDKFHISACPCIIFYIFFDILFWMLIGDFDLHVKDIKSFTYFYFQIFFTFFVFKEKHSS